MHHYPLQVFWSEEDETFIAIAPDLAGCSAAGETAAAAIASVHIAMDLWLDAMRKAGNPIPEPSKPILQWDLAHGAAEQSPSSVVLAH